MAHRWSNFDDAFDYFTGRFATLKSKMVDFDFNMNLAYTGCPDPVDRTHFYHLYSALQQLQIFLSNLTAFSGTDWDRSALFESFYWLGQEAGGGASYVLTMDDILSVMLSATDEEYAKFIGLVDAYRIGLWNKPFNSEFYAALGRGFTQ